MVPQQPRTRPNGFTILELMVAIAVLGIALAVTVPNFRQSMGQAQIDRATSELQSDLRLALSTARSTGRAVLFDFDARGYRLVDSTDTTRVYQHRIFHQAVAVASTGDPLVFPWGMVQPTAVRFAMPGHGRDLVILPTGRVEKDGEQ